MAAPKKSTKTRAEINKENAQKSAGPKTEEGKKASSRNAFKHSLYSQQLVVPGEDPAEFDELRAKLRDEHQPANTTEEILVDELAQHYWRMRRIRAQEVKTWQKGFEGPPDYPKIEFFARALTSAERSFHKTLTALQKLQKDRGFVPQKTVPAQAAAAGAPQTRFRKTLLNKFSNASSPRISRTESKILAPFLKFSPIQASKPPASDSPPLNLRSSFIDGCLTARSGGWASFDFNIQALYFLIQRR